MSNQPRTCHKTQKKHWVWLTVSLFSCLVCKEEGEVTNKVKSGSQHAGSLFRDGAGGGVGVAGVVKERDKNLPGPGSLE